MGFLATRSADEDDFAITASTDVICRLLTVDDVPVYPH
jgi:hypothetical protein